MSNVPADLQYTKEHEWIRENQAGTFQIGITDFAQGALGDIVYIQLPKVGQNVRAGEVCGEVESTKSVSEIYSPLTGTITAVNSALDTMQVGSQKFLLQRAQQSYSLAQNTKL